MGTQAVCPYKDKVPVMRTLRCCSAWLIAFLSFCIVPNAFPWGYENLYPSPAANGMAGILTSAEFYDPLAPMLNPAALGMWAEQERVAVAFYPKRTSWFPFWQEDSYYSTRALNFGFSAQDLSRWAKTTVPFSLGIGYGEELMDYGNVLRTDEDGHIIGTYHDYTKSRGLSLAAAYDGRVKAAVGLTLLDSRWKTYYDLPSVWAFNFGLLVQTPFPRILNGRKEPRAGLDYSVTPLMSYTMTDVGPGYWFEGHQYPLPREATLQFGLGGALTWRDHNDAPWTLLAVETAAQGETQLVDYHAEPYRYRQPLGDLHVFKDVIFGKSNDDIVKHKGWEVGFFDFYYWRRGITEQTGHTSHFQTEGYSLRLTGALRLLQHVAPELAAKPMLSYLTQHVDVRYNESMWRYHLSWDYYYGPSGYDKMFRSISLHFR
jgi:hypothetical protein